jgi:hypothetical protein
MLSDIKPSNWPKLGLSNGKQKRKKKSRETPAFSQPGVNCLGRGSSSVPFGSFPRHFFHFLDWIQNPTLTPTEKG